MVIIQVKPVIVVSAWRVASGSASDGANVQQWTCNNGTKQNWQFTLVNLIARRVVANSVEASLNVETYPNPITDVLYVENVAAGDLIYLYDSTGKLVLQQEITQPGWKITTTFLECGIYIMKIQGKENITFRRIIKQ